MMESSSLEEENIKDVENRFRLEKEIKVLKYRIFTNIRNLFEHESKGDTKKHYQLKNTPFFIRKTFIRK